jgi:hypothetical protein
VKLLGPILAAALLIELAAAGWEIIVHNIAIELAIIAAGLAGLGYIARGLYRRVLKPIWFTFRKIDKLYDALHDFPQWRKEMDKRMAAGAEHFERLDEAVAAWSNADAVRVRATLDQLQDPQDG